MRNKPDAATGYVPFRERTTQSNSHSKCFGRKHRDARARERTATSLLWIVDWRTRPRDKLEITESLHTYARPCHDAAAASQQLCSACEQCRHIWLIDRDPARPGCGTECFADGVPSDIKVVHPVVHSAFAIRKWVRHSDGWKKFRFFRTRRYC